MKEQALSVVDKNAHIGQIESLFMIYPVRLSGQIDLCSTIYI